VSHPTDRQATAGDTGNRPGYDLMVLNPSAKSMLHLATLAVKYQRAEKKQRRVEAIDRRTRTEELQANVYLSTEDGTRITEAIEDYLMSDADFPIYVERCHVRRLAAGLKLPNADDTSDKYTWAAVKRVEDAMLDWLEDNTHPDYRQVWHYARFHHQNRQKLTAALLGLASEVSDRVRAPRLGVA